MTVTCGTVTVVSPANITAINLVITPDESPCRETFCTVTVSVTWENQGDVSGDFVPKIIVDTTEYPLNLESLAANTSVTHEFIVSGLTKAGSPHSICPNPN